MVGRPHNVLGERSQPNVFPVGNATALGLTPPPPRSGVALRTWTRSLAGMQKEAVVVSSVDGRAWRLVSDEGSALDSYDEAPPPLAHMTAGMAASYLNEVTALARQRGMRLDAPCLTLHSHYAMEGSARRGTMTGIALSPEVELQAETDAGAAELRELLSDAVHASPVNGLLRQPLHSLFTLTTNGERTELDRAAPLHIDPPADPEDLLTSLDIAEEPFADGQLERLTPAEERAPAVSPDKSAGAPGFAETQSMQIRLTGVCRLRPDGLKEIAVGLESPVGSVFRFLSDESPTVGGQGRAPDALTYVSAGIAFCFMTQFGRYARIARKDLSGYRLIQDSHFSLGGASAGTGAPGTADAVESHVYLNTVDGPEFARQALDMSEQTCFLHGVCRTPLKTRIRACRPH
jgi:organic hydroperoxide reductase OsmC/OhrA